MVEAPTPEQAEAASLALAERLRAHPELFTDVEVPAAEPFFARNALLYLETPQLVSLAERLIAAGPVLGMLNDEPNLHGFTRTLQRILAETGSGGAIDASPLLRELWRTAEAELAGQAYATSWRTLFADITYLGHRARSLVLIKPVLDWRNLLAAERPIAAIRAAAASLQPHGTAGLRVRITGDAALAYEEIDAALGGTFVSVALALLVIAAVLGWGLRSGLMTVAALLSLATGLVMTAAFATWAVGELNLLSFAAGVLYLGLGVDYAIHFCLRYREAIDDAHSKAAALRLAASGVRAPLLLCASTTAAGFFAFLPTDFAGVAQLGVICGTGMFINLVVTLSLLPALLALLPAPARCPAPPPGNPQPDRMLCQYATTLARLGVVLGCCALAALPLIRFDRNPLNLRDPASESVATLHELRGDHTQPMTSITILASDAATAQRLAEALRALPTVREVLTPADLEPRSSAEKLAIIDDLNVLLGPALAVRIASRPESHDAQEALEALYTELGRYRDAGTLAQRREAARAHAALGALLHRGHPDVQAAGGALEARLLGTLPMALQELRTALQPDSGEFLRVPDRVRRRWVASDGTQRIVVTPREDISDNGALRRFVESVQAIAPDATDEPVLNLRAGDAVVQAFQEALAIAVSLAVGLLLLHFRSLTHAALALAPLVLAGLLTVATLAVAGVPFNFANIIALPLLLGANVDNGIHMVHRFYADGGYSGGLLRTSTSRAIMFSGLANLCGFANLLAAPHPGMASMGLVLTLGMAWTLLTTLFFVPALLLSGRSRS